MFWQDPKQNFRTVHNNETKRATDCYTEPNTDKLLIENRK